MPLQVCPTCKTCEKCNYNTGICEPELITTYCKLPNGQCGHCNGNAQTPACEPNVRPAAAEQPCAWSEQLTVGALCPAVLSVLWSCIPPGLQTARGSPADVCCGHRPAGAQS